jgi:hypothetical protein
LYLFLFLLFVQNPQVNIDRLLRFVGAKYGCYGAGLPDEQAKSKLDNDRESEIMKDSTQTLGIGSVLIATVAFGATFALPGGYRADDHPNGGTPTLAGRYSFDAFIMATTLAFVCASAATTGLMFSGMAMVDLPVRQKYFMLSSYLMVSSVTSLGASFALGLYMVLARVAHSTAIAVLVVTFAGIVVIAIIEPLEAMKILGVLRIRLGKRFWRIAVQQTVKLIGYTFWPFIIIICWPAYSAKFHN